MKKTVVIYVLCGTLLTGFSWMGENKAVKAEENNQELMLLKTDKSQSITIMVNGDKLKPEAAPVIVHGVTFVPLRAIAESLRAKATWDETGRTVIVQKDNDEVKHRIGTNQVEANGVLFELEANSIMTDGTPLVPLRAVAEGLHASVAYSSMANRIAIDVHTVRNNDDGTYTDYIAGSMEGVDRYLRDKHFSGSVLIAKNGNVLMKAGYGPSSIDGEANYSNTIYRLASISKMFTATAIMQLAEAGKLRTQDTLSQYIPDFNQSEDITIHMLLSHTSGISREYPRGTNLSLEQAVEKIKQVPLNDVPGKKFSYSNAGYLLLAYIIEKVSGQTYSDYLEEHIFRPLNMLHSGEAIPSFPMERGFEKNSRGEYAISPYYASNSGNGSLYSTVEDLYKWDRSLYTSQILSQQSLEKMFTPVSSGYGYGWIIGNHKGNKIMLHDGAGRGYSTILLRKPADDLCIILLSNISNIKMNELAKDVLNRIP